MWQEHRGSGHSEFNMGFYGNYFEMLGAYICVYFRVLSSGWSLLIGFGQNKESASILLTLTLLLDTRPVLTCRFMHVHVCVWVCERALVSWPPVLAKMKADSWNKWVISFMRSVLSELGFSQMHCVPSRPFFSLCLRLSVYSESFISNDGINIQLTHPSLPLCFFSPQARIPCISPSVMSITNHSQKIARCTFLSPFIDMRLDEGWPWVFLTFRSLWSKK